MQAIPLVLAQALRPLVTFRDRMGAAPARLPVAVRAGHTLVPLAYGGELWEETAQAVGDPGLGLRVGAASRFEDAPLGRHVSASFTVGQALEAAARAGGRYNTGQRLWLSRHGNEVWVRRRFSDALTRGRRQANDFALQLLLDLVRRAAGRDWLPREIHFEGPPPAHAEELAALAAGSVRFGAEADGLVLPSRLLALPLPSAQASGPEPPLLPASDFAGSLRQTIRALLELGRLELPGLAEAAGTSVRSLQRRLAGSSLSFTRLVDEARFDVASRLLSDPSIRIIDVSMELGYTDSANFTRAFRRWAGVPPLAYRRAARPAPRWREMTSPQAAGR